MNHRLRSVAFAVAVALTMSSRAEEITGVQAVALDQPRIFLQLRRSPSAPALAVKVEKEQAGAIEAFLDTGASGIVIADSTAKALKLAAAPGVKFEDVGVGGSEEFGVSEPLYVSLAAYSSNTDGDSDAAYSRPAGPLRVQLKPSGGLLDELTGGLDIVGMPGMSKLVMVMDCRPVAKMDKIKTSLVAPGDRSIPQTGRTVPLTYVSFARYTRLTPPAAQGPAVAANPMIGPDPFKPADRAAPVMVKYKGKSASLTMLLDTGAACSMISRKKAAELGVTYAKDGTTLNGVPANEQFSFAVGGIGGSKKSTGFFLDLLVLPAKAGQPVTYAKAPLLVSDVTAVDAAAGKSFTLDGVFGMNFLVASAEVTGGLLPDIGKIADGPFQFVVIDHVHATLGLK